MRTLYRGALVLWLVSGFGLHAYFSRAAQGTAEVEKKRDLHLRQFENNDAVARQIREAHWDARSRAGGAYAGWALVGFVLAMVGVRSLFRKADQNAALDKFLAVSLVLILLPGCMRQPFEPVKLETIGPNEEGFLIPYTGDTRKQTSTNNVLPRGAPVATPGCAVERLRRSEIARCMSDPGEVAQRSPGSLEVHPGTLDLHGPDRDAR